MKSGSGNFIFSNKVKSKFGLTLVELIVVIAILAILGTVAIVSLQNHASSARDGSRAADINSLAKIVELYQVTAGNYPSPDNYFTVTYSGGSVWTQGTVGSGMVTRVQGILKGGGISKKPEDPLDQSEYVYSTLTYGRAFQLKTEYENDSIALRPFVQTAFAASTTQAVYIKGTYQGLTARTETGSIIYVLALPSIITNTGSPGGSLDIAANVLSGKLLMHGKPRNGISYNPNVVIFSGSILPGNDSGGLITNMMSALKNTYSSNSDLISVPEIQTLINTATGSLSDLGASVINNQLGGAVSATVYASCSSTSYSGYILPNLSHAQSQSATKTGSTASGTLGYSMTTTCNNGLFLYGTETITVSCESGTVEGTGYTCIPDVCGGTIADPNAHSTATSQTVVQNWTRSATPGICTWDCNANFTWDGSSCKASCDIPNTDTHSTQLYTLTSTGTLTNGQTNQNRTGSLSFGTNPANGTLSATFTYSCNNGILSSSTANGVSTCGANYTFNANWSAPVCAIDTFSVSGSFGADANGATVSVCGSNVTADASGNFLRSNVPYGSTCNNITATRAGYTCTTITNGPANLISNISNISGNCSVNAPYADDVFSTYVYAGNGSTQAINNGIDLSGQGGMVWTKPRTGSVAMDHQIFDTLRGVQKTLVSNTNGSEYTNTNLLSFNSNGFTLGSQANTNISGNTSVSWTFRRAPKFFDMITYSGDGNAGRILSHSLGITPGMVIIKRTDTTGQWIVYHGSVGVGSFLTLETAGAPTAVGMVTGVSPTNITLAQHGGVNASGGSYVAYIFAHDTSSDGIIQAGSFTTDASGNGPSVNLGWEPQFILQKQINGADDWIMIDTIRGAPVAGTDRILRANTTTAETLNGYSTIENLGFKGQGTANATYMYLAIRRSNKPPTSPSQVFAAEEWAGSNTDAVARFNSSGIKNPDMVLTKNRNNAVAISPFSASNGSEITSFVDRLRGGNKVLVPYNTDIEYNVSGNSMLFNSKNVTFPDANPPFNINGGLFSSYAFSRASGVFDIVGYTGNGSSTTIYHNLGTMPELIIRKARVTTSVTYGDNWYVWCKSANNSHNGGAFIQSNDQYYPGDTAFTEIPTATTFKPSGSVANVSNKTYISYLFASKPGISKVGSYTGNGSTQVINANFTSSARFILIKRTDTTGDWYIWDSARGIVTGNDPHFSLNTTATEVSTDDSIDPDNSGFIVNQNSATNINVSGATYIYLAFQ